MPSRYLKESITTSETLDRLSPEAELFFYRLLVVVDDFGRADARPPVLAAKCFPLRLATIKPANVEKWTTELAEAGLIQVYEAEGRLLLQFAKWSAHNKPRAKTPKFPGPESGRVLVDARKRPQSSADANIRSQMHPYSSSYSDSSSGSSSSSSSKLPTASAAGGDDPGTDHRRFVEAFDAKYREKHGGAKPTWGAKQGKLVKDLLAKHGVEECLRRAAILFSSPPSWITTFDLGTLVQHFDKLAAPAPPVQTRGQPTAVHDPAMYPRFKPDHGGT